MVGEAAGSIAAISHLPKPLGLQTKMFCSGYRPALFLSQLTASFFCTRQTPWQRGRWKKSILSTLLIFPHWKSRITDDKGSNNSHLVLSGTFQSPLCCNIQLHTVKFLHVTHVFLFPFTALRLPMLHMTTNCNFACYISKILLLKIFFCAIQQMMLHFYASGKVFFPSTARGFSF